VGLGGILGDNCLSTLDDGGAVSQGLRLGGLALLAGNFLTFLSGLLDCLDAASQRRNVPDDVR